MMLGGQAGACLALGWGMAISPDTLLRRFGKVKLPERDASRAC